MSSRRLRAMPGVVAACAVLLAGCWSAPRPAPTPTPLRPDWRAVALPTPPGAPGRLLLRDAVACGGRWFVVGAVADAAGVTRPAAWSSPDATAWTSLRLAARSGYGPENVLTAVGCRDGRLAAVGAKSGGVHGNPRVSTWRQLADGSVVEVPAEFEVFGGPDAVNVGRIAGGPEGWVIAGNRGTGAAAWSSVDAGEFRLVSGVPPLASDAAGRTWAADVAAGASGWVLVGSSRTPGRPGGEPAVWTSPDGLDWRRETLSDADAPGDLQRVVRAGERLVAVGRRGDGVGAWIEGPGGAAGATRVEWRPGGVLDRAGGASAQVAGLAAVDGGMVAVVLSDAGGAAWFSTDGGGWSPVLVPAPLPVGADRSVAVAGAGDRVLLLVDGARGTGVWSARMPDGPG
ncbi:hypothetical protein [Micromonospora sp. NPDC001898]|uniref:hypothetical protein n=1 Tax=Micromonospora sp. NPDC001898 TaxID=3364221 RepID=UPI0036A5921B